MFKWKLILKIKFQLKNHLPTVNLSITKIGRDYKNQFYNDIIYINSRERDTFINGMKLSQYVMTTQIVSMALKFSNII